MALRDDLKPLIVNDGVSFDLLGVRIGTAEYREGPTGCSVFHFPEGAVCEVDARGGRQDCSAAIHALMRCFFPVVRSMAWRSTGPPTCSWVCGFAWSYDRVETWRGRCPGSI